MADDRGEQQGSAWPLPKFYFSVQLGDGMDVKFQEVAGLESETPAIEYRHGDGKVFDTIKMPGLRKVGNATMRKGVFANDQKFWHWLSGIKMNTISPRTVVINLLDETGAPKMVWTLHNAWPTKITVTDLKSDDSEVGVETLVLSFESLEVKAG